MEVRPDHHSIGDLVEFTGWIFVIVDNPAYTDVDCTAVAILSQRQGDPFQFTALSANRFDSDKVFR